MDEMTEIECVLDTNCTVEMDPEIFKSEYLERRYTESWLGALVALVLLFCLFLCEILISIRIFFFDFIFLVAERLLGVVKVYDRSISL